jgi:hypothetical protein
VIFPDTTLIIEGLSYQGVQLDLEMEFEDATVRDGDAAFVAEARVLNLLVGGIGHTFEIFGPLEIEGALSERVFTTGLFGTIRVGTANLILDLTGVLSEDRARIEGEATLLGTSDRGAFTGIKRRRYLVAGTDLLTIGQVAVVSARYDTAFSVEHNLEVISSDPVARMEDGRPFVLNLLNHDNLQGLDPFSGFRTAFQYTLGNGANPHDLVVVPNPDGPAPADGGAGEGEGLAFVTRYEPPFNDVAILDLRDGALVDSIDLTPFARNADGLPRAHQAILHEDLIYVSMQDADASFTEFMNGRVVVIDPVLRQVVDLIDLSGQNPFQALLYSEATGLLYVGLAGIFPGLQNQALTGGVEAIDPSTRLSLGLVVDDDDLGGNVSAVAIISATRGYCVVSDSNFHNFVKAFDPSTGEVLDTVFDSFNQIATIEFDGDGHLIVADTSFFQPRLIVLDAASGIPIAFLPMRVPPFSIATITRSL